LYPIEIRCANLSIRSGGPFFDKQMSQIAVPDPNDSPIPRTSAC
jgi:hypothetical protein